MTFFTALRPFALTVAACAILPGFAALAQETAPAADATAPAAVNEPFVASAHNAWEVVCRRADDSEALNCEMYQLLLDPEQQPIAEISIAALPFGAEFAAGATITTPLETFLPFGMGWIIGDAEEMRVEAFRVCTVVGCLIRMGLTPDEVDAMRAGANAKVVIAPFAAIDQPVEINVSLSGFTAAYEALQTQLATNAQLSR